MNRIILRALNAPVFVILIVIGLAIESALFNSFPLKYFQPNIILLGTLWVSLRRNFTEGGVLTLVISYLGELNSSAPQGLFMVSTMLIYLSIRGLDRYFLMSKVTTILGLTFGATLFWHTSNLFQMNLLELPRPPLEHSATLALLGAAVNSVIGFWIYRFFEHFDLKTFRDPRMKHALEDDLQLGDEGL